MMDASIPSVRARMAGAARRIGRLKRIDRAAVGVITLGGVSVIIAVLGILVFIAAQAVPLFKPATLSTSGQVRLDSRPYAVGAASLPVFGTDEYRKYIYTVEPDGRLVFYRYDSGAAARELPVPGLGAATITASSKTLLGNFVAAGTSDGCVSLMQIRFTPQYQGQKMVDLAIDLRERGLVEIDPGKRPVRDVSYLEQEGQKFVAALLTDREIAYWWTDTDAKEWRAILTVPAPQRVTAIRLGRNGALIAGTDRGNVYHWIPQPDMRLTDVSPVGGGGITALEWVLGGKSWVAGTEDGSVSAWFRAPLGAENASVMVRAHTYERQSSAVVAIAMSGRERSFATAGRDGTIILRHFTSERVLADVSVGEVVRALLITPKADGLLAARGGLVDRFAIVNPHPETSWTVLFGKVWYEGYAKPEYVWQSTGATDDVEAKLSLVPLIFGTIKGTLYAMLFAVPLSVLSALYTSQFVHPSIRAKIKPTVEIMAALPSVVIGFLAGLYLASIVEKNLVAMAALFVVAPLFGTVGVLVWRVLPRRILARLRPGTELAVIVPMLLAAVWLTHEMGPSLERWLFTGDARFWLKETLGLTYDQRNCIVVGLAMGFAVIPIIFTISEDAFSSVPSNLTAASLALGASRWQTAVRVVMPTASPGIFSAIMVGFGRAVGETMIVLMATGNTPLMDWSIFNGMRTLVANIAVEIPESPQAGTLYRTLFLTASLLFVLTFLVNTVAEVIRQRLRERYKAV
ncbi:MAG: ABC transporter permease subunit [Acidobacteria bacterium]|nr:ABC transporter permease subunit [Acidobacteriota bacterium]